MAVSCTRIEIIRRFDTSRSRGGGGCVKIVGRSSRSTSAGIRFRGKRVLLGRITRVGPTQKRRNAFDFQTGKTREIPRRAPAAAAAV